MAQKKFVKKKFIKDIKVLLKINVFVFLIFIFTMFKTLTLHDIVNIISDIIMKFCMCFYKHVIFYYCNYSI